MKTQTRRPERQYGHLSDSARVQAGHHRGVTGGGGGCYGLLRAVGKTPEPAASDESMSVEC